MKRILLTTAAALLGLGALGFASSHAAAPVQANCDDDLSAKLLSYTVRSTEDPVPVPVGYTKLTTMFLTEDAQKETQYFHAGANTLQRATYYNAGETALLMGNYDGTFGGVGGATGINSGYRNNDENGVTHFTYTGNEPTEENLFEAVNHSTGGWKAAGQRLGTYYRTLTQLSNSVKGTTWEWDSTYKAWVHSIKSLTITNGEYSDPLLKDFQYFAAPMMLQNNYFTWHSIRVTEASNFLSIRLYGSSSDAGKSTVVGEDEVLISEAKVFKGIHFAPKPETEWVIRGINGWEAEHDIPLVEFTDIYAPEQYTASTAIELDNKFKIVDRTKNKYLGFSEVGLGSDAWFYSSDPNGDFGSRLKGEITLWWQPTRPYLWISVNKVNVTFQVTVSSIDEGKAVYVIGNFTDPEWTATPAYKLSLDDGKWVGAFEMEPGSYAWQPVKADAINPTDMEKHSGASDWNFSFNDETYLGPNMTMHWHW